MSAELLDGAPKLEMRPSKRSAGDESPQPQSNNQPKHILPAQKIPREKSHNLFLCIVSSCEIVVTEEVFGFSRETALLERYKMHFSNGEVPQYSSNSLVGFC